MQDDSSSARETSAIVTDDFGLDRSASDLNNTTALRDTFLEAIRAKNRSQWTIGDCYLALSDANEDAAQALDATALSLKTAQNYASTCAIWSREWRIVPLSMSHYAAAAALARVKPTEALALLRQAYDGGMSREWVREQAGLLLDESDVSIEVMLTWDELNQVFIPNQTLHLPKDFTRTLKLRQTPASQPS